MAEDAPPAPPPEVPIPEQQDSLLGFRMSEFGGLSVDELVDNKTAITMLLHYYKKLVDDNAGLRNDLNTYKTYKDGYHSARHNSKIGATLLAISNVGVAFGLNLLTSNNYWAGSLTLAPGLLLLGSGLYFSLRDSHE